MILVSWTFSSSFFFHFCDVALSGDHLKKDLKLTGNNFLEDCPKSKKSVEIRFIRQLVGENGQFWHNRASNA
jgi:hypothetical protein